MIACIGARAHTRSAQCEYLASTSLLSIRGSRWRCSRREAGAAARGRGLGAHHAAAPRCTRQLSVRRFCLLRMGRRCLMSDAQVEATENGLTHPEHVILTPARNPSIGERARELLVRAKTNWRVRRYHYLVRHSLALARRGDQMRAWLALPPVRKWHPQQARTPPRT